jgi:lipopolysaccharide export system permease protein
MGGLAPRYLLREMVAPFGFFVLVLTGVIWLTQSLRVVDTVVNSGQGAGVFLQFSLLLLPTALGVVLPLAGFAATLYAINRLFAESEIVAMVAAGMSGLALARPVAMFGAAIAAAAAALSLHIAPLAQGEMRDRVHALRADIANALIFEGRFLHPAPGLTIYVRERAGAGEMRGVFVHDQRDPTGEVTYTASRAALTQTAEGPRLLMLDGAAQRRGRERGELSVLRFESLVFDLAQFMADPGDRGRKASEHSLRELLAGEGTWLPRGRRLAEAHERMSAPLYGLALPLVALAAILGPGFTRRGYGQRVIAAVAIGVGLRGAGLALKAATVAEASLWPLLYAPPLLGVALSLWALSRPQLQGFRARGAGA